MVNISTIASKTLSAALAAALLSSCASMTSITNVEAVSEGKSYQYQYHTQEPVHEKKITPIASKVNEGRCLAQGAPSSTSNNHLSAEVLSPGDMVQVAVGIDDTYSGSYEISSDGQLKLRGANGVSAIGRSAVDVGNDVADALVAGGIYRTAPVVSVRLVDFGAARTFVEGAVFEPGTVTLGGSAISNDDGARQQASGGSTYGRRLSKALQNAGGVRPDADLSRVVLKRKGRTTILDIRPAIAGGRFDDVIMIEGDEISVPSRGCFQSALVVPSVISPPGAKAFMSNLTEPANSNANSGIDKDTRELRYGTRMLQAIVSMNCVGGSKLTNASRTAVLYSRNPVTGQSIVIERNIEQLVRNGNRDDFDPFILPNDALACYDSGATDIVKLAQGFGIVAGAVVASRGF